MGIRDGWHAAGQAARAVPLTRRRPDMMAQHQVWLPCPPGRARRSAGLGGTIVPRRVHPRRMVALILSPAATTATACSLPGERVSRSIGPDTDAAAITFPPCPRTGADTDATPGSRSATLAAQPRRRTWASAVA